MTDENKGLSGTPLATISLTIRTGREHRSRKKLRVVIWKHLKDLRAAARASSTHSTARFWQTAAGAYVGVRAPRQFGEIHLWTKWMGAGYFAHELQHFMEDYRFCTEKHPLDDRANERMAYLAGDLTAQFWTKYYEHFQETP